MIYLIDYENVKSLTGIAELSNSDSVIVFYTKNANTLTFDDLFVIQGTEIKIECKQVATGNNALDFQLSTYLGFLIGQNFTDFCIVSKDKGYDSIINFWKNEKGITIQRRNSLSKTPVTTPKETLSQENPPKQEKKTTPQQPTQDMKTVLSSLNLTKNEIAEVKRIVDKYKTKQTINSNLQKHFKDNEKVGQIYKAIKPYLKDKN